VSNRTLALALDEVPKATDAPAVVTRTRFYLPSLEGLRFLAFIFIFMRHMPTPDVPILSFLHGQGEFGIPVFFALSAFLLFSLCYMDGTPAAWPAYLRFTIRRALRVMPLVTVFTLTCLVIALLTQSIPASQAIGRALGAIFYVDNLICWVKGLSKLPYTMHLWTLSYEMQFYPFIPLFAAAAIASQKRFWIVLAIVAGWAFAIHVSFALLGVSRWALFMTPFISPMPVLCGMGFGVLYLTGALPRISWWVALPLAAVGFACVAIAPPELHAPYTLVVYPALALTAAGTLWAAIFFAPVRWLLSLRSLVFLGKISYGLYVFHLPAIAVFKHMAPEYGIEPQKSLAAFVLVAGLAGAITVLCAVASWYLLERPFLKLKAHFEDVPSRPV
jgi:peptidoglycan/LPS O-acetylase OafA/YrhL